jgi:hypothetical protein
MSRHAIKSLRTTVSVVLNTDRYGGKLIERDDSTVVLKDYRCISMRLLDLIHEQFPQVDVTIQSHEDSVSGFVVVFVLRDSASVFRTSTFAQTVIFCCLVALSVTYDYIFATFSLVWI